MGGDYLSISHVTHVDANYAIKYHCGYQINKNQNDVAKQDLFTE